MHMRGGFFFLFSNALRFDRSINDVSFGVRCGLLLLFATRRWRLVNSGVSFSVAYGGVLPWIKGSRFIMQDVTFALVYPVAR